LICAAVMVAVPPAPKVTVSGWQVAVGAILSATVTVVVQVDLLPLASVTCNVTWLGPTLVQLKSICEAVDGAG